MRAPDPRDRALVAEERVELSSLAMEDLAEPGRVEVERLSEAIHDDLTRALELREAGKGDSVVYAIHDRLGQPCPQCGTPIARVDFEEHTIYYCPSCQTGGRLLKDRRLSRLLR